MKLTFWGAARQVTGSMFLLELEDGYQILIECGFDMDRHKQNPADTKPTVVFPFDPRELDLVIATHAHIDHTGQIPNLYRAGYKGQVLATKATMDLTYLLLMDSARINEQKLAMYKKQEQEKKKKGKRNRTRRRIEINTAEIYIPRDVDQAIDHFVTLAFNSIFEPREGVSVEMIPAGHLLGAAHVMLKIKENGAEKSILFSGDIGRKNYPLLRDPQPPPSADYLVCETTYGNREHISTDDAAEELVEIITKSCVEKAGRLIIPAFSVGRSQAIIYLMHKLAQEGRLPHLPIYADSPLAEKSNAVYDRYTYLMNDEANAFAEQHGRLFQFEQLRYLSSIKESKEVSKATDAGIIISSSGMLDGGRIRHHVTYNLPNPYCTMLFVGFCAEGTLGHTLLTADGSARVGGKEVAISAEILRTDVLSGHGDRQDLLRFVGAQSPEKLRQTFLVHGEYESMCSFQRDLQERGYKNVTIPSKEDSFEL